MKVTGVITNILPTEEGVSKADKPWKKLTFVLETSEEYNNIYALEVFGGRYEVSVLFLLPGQR